MLALNVSVEVLDGFKTVDDSLGDSSATLKERNGLIMDELTATTWRTQKSGRMVRKRSAGTCHERFNR